MFFKRVYFIAAAWFLCTSLTFAQLVEEKKKDAPNGKQALVLKIDPKALPADARLRLGKMGGYRYTGTFSFAILSPDGKLLAINGLNSDHIAIIDLPSGKSVQEIGRPGGGNTNMAFSPDGKSLAVVSFAQDLKIYDVATGKQLQQFAHRDNGGSRQFGPSFSRDGKILGVGVEGFGPNNNITSIKAWEVAPGKLIGPFEAIHNYNVRVAIAPDGKSMVSWGQFLPRNGGVNNNRDLPRTLQVWDLANGKELRQLKIDFGPQGFGNAQNAVFTPDGKTLVVSSGSSTFHLLDYESGKETRRFSGQRSNGATMLRISPDGELLAAYDTNGMLQAWQLKSGKRIELMDGPKMQFLSVGFPGNNRILVLGSQGQSLHWWDATATEKTPLFEGHLTALAAVAFLPDGKTVLSAGNNQRLIWWNAQTGEEQRSLHLIDSDMYYGGYGGGNTNSFALSSDGRFAATQSNSGNGGVRLWSLKTGRVLCDFEGPRAYSQVGFAFSPDSTKLAATGSQNPLHIWDINTGQELPKLSGEKQNNNPNDFGNSRVAFSPDGKVLAVHLNQFDRFTGMPISDLILWDMVQGKEIQRTKIPMTNNNGNVMGGLAFSANSKLLAVCEGSGTILLLNGANGKEWRRFTSAQRNSTFQLTFSSDGRFLAAGSSPNQFAFNPFGKPVVEEPTVEVWEIASGQLREQFKGHTGSITCMAFSPDGATLATGSQDATLILWDFTGKSGVKLPPITEDELPAAWKTLTANDKQLSSSIRRLIATPTPTLAFLKKNFPPVKEAEISPATLEKLIARLDSRNYELRDKAMRELQQLGERVEIPLKKALAANPSLEVRRRINDLLVKMERSSFTPEELQGMRGVEVLERIGSDEACAWLATLASGTSTARLTIEAQAALKRLHRN